MAERTQDTLEGIIESQQNAHIGYRALLENGSLKGREMIAARSLRREATWFAQQIATLAALQAEALTLATEIENEI